MSRDVVWLDVLPSMGAFGSEILKGATKASEEAGRASGAAFGKKLTEGATSGQAGIVASLEKTSKAAQRAVERETQAIARARAAQREAAAKVIEAEAKLEQARASGDSAKIAAAEERLAGARERAAGAASGVEAAEKRLAAATSARNQAAEDLAKAEKELAATTGQVGEESKKAGSAMDRFKEKLFGVEGGADGALGGLKRAGAFMRDNLGKIALGAGGAAVAAAKGLYEVGSTFDDVLDTIRTGTGATGDTLDGLFESAKKVGNTIPAEFAKIGPVLADVNTRTGLTGDTLEKVSSQYLEAGRILGEEVSIADTTAAFNAFKISGEGVAGAMDSLFQISQATGVGMNDLAKQVQDNAPAMQNLGFSFEETAALVGQLDKAGLESGATLNAMSKGLVTLAKDGEKPQEAFRRVTGEIQRLVDKGDTAKAIDLASGIFGTRAANQFVGAVQSGTMALDDLVAATGATADTILGVGEETADFAEQWQLVKNNAATALEPLGSAVFSVLGDSLKEVMPHISAFGEWAKENPDTIKGVAIGLGILAGALGVAAAAQWAMNSAFLANPITWVIFGIGLLIAAIVLLVQNWDSVVAFLGDVFGPALDAAGQWFEDVGAWFGDTWDEIQGFFQGGVDWVTNTWSTAWEATEDFLQDPVGNAAGAIDGVLGTDLRGSFDRAKSWMADTWSKGWSAVDGFLKDPVGSARKGIDDHLAGTQRLFDGAAGWVKRTFPGLWNVVDKIMRDPVGAALDGIRALLGPLGLQGAFDTAVSAVGRIWDGVKDKIAAPVRWVSTHVLNPLASGIEKIAGLFGLKWSLPRFSFADGGMFPAGGGGRRVALADGGMMPGYTPGRDVHRFWSPTAGLLELSGGEPVLRPEAGAVLGSTWVDGINAAARTGGQDGVRQFLHEQGFAMGGTVSLPDKAAKFATGGIVPNATQGLRGYDPTALAMIQAWARATGRLWYMTGIGGARDYATQLAAYRRHLAGTGPLAANPARGGPHMMPAIAMDLRPRPGEIPAARALLRQFGLGLPVRGEPWHVQYLAGRRGGAATGGGGLDVVGLLTGAIGTLAKVKDAGPWGDLLNAIPKTLLDKAASGIKAKVFDGGGLLPPGLTVAVNGTGRPERILTDPQWDAITKANPATATRDETVAVRELREALRGLRLRIDLDNGEAWFDDHYDARQTADLRRRRAHTG